MRSRFIIALLVLFTLGLLAVRPKAQVQILSDIGNCMDGDIGKWSVAQKKFICQPGLSAGTVVMIVSGSCPTNFSEATEFNGKTLVGTLTANGNVGTYGGADTVIPGGLNDGCSTVRVTKNPAGDAIVCSPSFTPVFTGDSLDNRSAFMRVIFCKRD